MQIFYSLLQYISLFVLLMIPGYIMGRGKRINDSGSDILTNILTDIAMPFLVFSKLLNMDLSVLDIPSVICCFLFPIVSIVGIFLLSVIVFPKIEDGSRYPVNRFCSMMAGTDDYDAVSGNLWWAGSLALQGMLTNLSDAPYLELDAEWWPTEYLDGFSYKGNCYWLTGPMELAWVSEKACMFYNEHLWNTLYEEDIYDTVDNGKFTFEFLNRIANEVYQDLNGNSKVDEDDRMGYAIKSDSNIDTYASGAGVVIAPFDSDGVPYLKFLDDMTRIEAFWEKFLQFKTNDNVLYIQWAGSDTTIINMELFREGNLMFVQGFLSHTTDQLRDMEDDYGVLPMPKLDETQENYLQIINNRVALFGIPVTVSDEGFNAVCAVILSV